MNSWLRWYIGTCEDGKFRMIARNGKVTVGNAISIWAMLLEDASHPDHRGYSLRGEDYYAAILDIDSSEIKAILLAMESCGMINLESGNILICNWNKRQFDSDNKDPTNAERQRRFKGKKKGNTIQTEGNGKVTVGKRPDTDTDTDKKEDTLTRVSKKSDSRGSRLSLKDPPQEWIDFCLERRPDLNVKNTFDLFHDYWIAVSGKSGYKLDWFATWKNWIRNTHEGVRGVSAGIKSKSQRAREAIIAGTPIE